jgi:hypothetical protein
MAARGPTTWLRRSIEPRRRRKIVKNRMWQFLFVGALAGCSAYVPPALGPDHPASVNAPEAPPPPPSQTLAGEPVVSTPASKPPPSGHAGHGMQGMDEGMEGMPGMHMHGGQ